MGAQCVLVNPDVGNLFMLLVCWMNRLHITPQATPRTFCAPCVTGVYLCTDYVSAVISAASPPLRVLGWSVQFLALHIYVCINTTG